MPDDQPVAPRLPGSLDDGRVSLTDEAQWEGLRVTGDFSGAAASLVDVTGCRLAEALLTGTEIDRLRLADAVVEDCDFSGAVLSRLAAVRVEFRRCRLSGVIAPGAGWKDVAFVDCKLDAANLRMTTWQRSRFDGCLLRDADFGSAGMSGVALHGCDLTGADFSKAKMAGVSLVGSTLEGIRGAEALRGVTIGSDQVISLALSLFSTMGIRLEEP